MRGDVLLRLVFYHFFRFFIPFFFFFFFQLDGSSHHHTSFGIHFGLGRVLAPEGFRTKLLDPLRMLAVDSDSDVPSRASFGVLPLVPDSLDPLK